MAIVAVHWAGYPCDMDGLLELGQKHNIKIIEDAAHALNATYKGSPIGSISDFTCFSFQAIKHLTTGDGGAICCKNPKDATVAKNLRWFDIDRNNSQADILGERVYDATHTGYKYHMNDFAACMGIGNLRRVRDNITKVREIAARYNDELKDVAGVTLMDYKPDRQSSYWLYPMIVENRVRFIQKLKEAGIPTSVVHVGIDKNSIFGIKRESLVNQRFFDQNQIHIPINFKLTSEEVSHIIATIKGGW
jgi:perosamine synthetase